MTKASHQPNVLGIMAYCKTHTDRLTRITEIAVYRSLHDCMHVLHKLSSFHNSSYKLRRTAFENQKIKSRTEICQSPACQRVTLSDPLWAYTETDQTNRAHCTRRIVLGQGQAWLTLCSYMCINGRSMRDHAHHLIIACQVCTV